MATVTSKIADLEKIIADAAREREKLFQARKGEAGAVVEKMGLLALSDEALAGALSVLVGASPRLIAELEGKGATFLSKRRAKGRSAAGGDSGANNEASAGATGASEGHQAA